MSSCTTSTVILSESAAVSSLKLPACLANSSFVQGSTLLADDQTSMPAAHNTIIFSIYNFSIPFRAIDRLLFDRILHVLLCACYVLQGNVLGHVLHRLFCTGVQVSLEDAEVLLGTAERTNIVGQTTHVPYKVQPVNIVTELQSNNM